MYFSPGHAFHRHHIHKHILSTAGRMLEEPSMVDTIFYSYLFANKQWTKKSDLFVCLFFLLARQWFFFFFKTFFCSFCKVNTKEMQPVNLNLLIYCCWITTFYWIMLLWVSFNICGYWFSVALLCVRPIINVPLSCVWVCVFFLPTSERACLREKPIGVGLGSSSGWKIANFVWLGPGGA